MSSEQTTSETEVVEQQPKPKKKINMLSCEVMER